MNDVHDLILREFMTECEHLTDPKQVVSVCALCGNSGIVDTTTTAKSPDGQCVGGKYFCVCTTGQSMAGNGPHKIESEVALESIRNVEINMGDCAIQFYNYNGDLAKTGDVVRSWLWSFVSDKIDPENVISVTIPKLTYDSTEPLKIMVEIGPTL